MRAERKNPARATPAPKVSPKATKADLLAPSDHTPHDIIIRLPGGRTATWTVMARELSYEEQAGITDRYTKIVGRGRHAAKEINLKAAMRDILAAMIDGPRCDPPLTQEELQRLRGPAFTAFSQHFGLTDEAEEEVEKAAGESDAP